MKCVLVTVICGLFVGSLADFTAKGALKARDAEQFLKERSGSHIVLKNREITEEQREAALHQVHTQARSSERIIGGHALGLSATPWVATLVAVPGKNDPEDFVFCPVTLIQGGYGITAAECLIANNVVGYPVGVIAGVNNLTAAFAIGNSTQFLDICSYALIWSNETQDIEQGILVVDFPYFPVYGPTVQAVQLPSNTSVFTGNTCATSGWGSTSGTNTFPQILQTANLTVQNPSVCASAYPDFCNDSEICAGVTNSAAGICVGDAGAPLVCTTNNVQYLAGVGVERSANCTSTPSVYANLAFYSNYLSWYLGFLDTLCICEALDYY